MLMAQANQKAAGRPARPLSPHLSIYRLSNSMLMSILHRITGGALYFGTLLLAWWLVAAAVGPSYYAFVNGVLWSWPGKIVLIGYTWALMHHMLGGIRHLIWDTGRGFDLKSVNTLSNATLIGSLVLTALIWLVALRMKGLL
jgi:succinate dehydrogenase / fumarate reductase cytochrome b subunit